MLDDAGLPNCKITASNALDEHLIRDLVMQGAQIDTFGVGERLITSKSEPVFGGVYKLAAVENDKGEYHPQDQGQREHRKDHQPRLSSASTATMIRTAERRWRMSCACGMRRSISPSLTISLIPMPPGRSRPWKTTPFGSCWSPSSKTAELVYKLPELKDIQTYCKEQQDTLWDEVKRFENPHKYYVDLSWNLWTLKRDLLAAAKK